MLVPKQLGPLALPQLAAASRACGHAGLGVIAPGSNGTAMPDSPFVEWETWRGRGAGALPAFLRASAPPLHGHLSEKGHVARLEDRLIACARQDARGALSRQLRIVLVVVHLLGTDIRRSLCRTARTRRDVRSCIPTVFVTLLTNMRFVGTSYTSCVFHL